MIPKNFTQLLSFIGTVEAVDDPLQLGRCRVRVLNYHDDTIPTEQLDWATPLQNMSGAVEGAGTSPTWYQVGSIVVGFYLDGEQRTMPMIIGSIAVIPDGDESRHGVNKLARGIAEAADRVGPEPSRPNQREYPHNKVIATPGGHTIELDDTPGAERINIQHKSGSYIEINNEGRVVVKSHDNHYTINAKDSISHTEGKSNTKVKGNCVLEVDGTLKLNSKGNCTIQSNGTINLKGARINLQ